MLVTHHRDDLQMQSHSLDESKSSFEIYPDIRVLTTMRLLASDAPAKGNWPRAGLLLYRPL